MTEKVKKILGLIYLDRNYLAYYGANLSDIVKFDFAANIIKDLEILNKSELETQLNLFIRKLKINPGNLLLVLSDDVCFTEDFPVTTTEQQDTLYQNFIGNIPFENIGSKIYKIDRGFRVIAVNKDLYESLYDVLNKMGFVIVAVAPAVAVGLTVKNFDLASAKFLLEKHDLVKQQSFILPQPTLHRPTEPEKKVFGVKRVLILLLFFSILLSVLLYMIYRQATQYSYEFNDNKYIKLVLDKVFRT